MLNMEEQLKIISNKKIANDVYEMILESTKNINAKPGQFISIQIPGLYLRRPISVCDCNKNRITLIYKNVGKGTSILKDLKQNYKLNCLMNLGNGYDLTKAKKNTVLVGGGVGVPPMFYLAKKLKIKPTIVLCFNSKCDVFYVNEFKKLGLKVIVATMDGTYGIKGNAIDALNGIKADYIYTCGPLRMMEALTKIIKKGQCSLEERMGCSYGACMGCTHEFKSGFKRVCKEGPVFEVEDIIW